MPNTLEAAKKLLEEGEIDTRSNLALLKKYPEQAEALAKGLCVFKKNGIQIDSSHRKLLAATTNPEYAEQLALAAVKLIKDEVEISPLIQHMLITNSQHAEKLAHGICILQDDAIIEKKFVYSLKKFIYPLLNGNAEY